MNDCTNCRFAEWRMTEHNPPRINRYWPGRCLYNVPPLPLPKSIDYNEVHRVVGLRYRQAILSTTPYRDCPVWEAKCTTTSD